jgi:hypothetical protein
VNGHWFHSIFKKDSCLTEFGLKRLVASGDLEGRRRGWIFDEAGTGGDFFRRHGPKPMVLLAFHIIPSNSPGTMIRKKELNLERMRDS